MATNRTATTKWRKARDTARRNAKNNGQTQCPTCKVTLDWEHSRTPTSAEVDHIIPDSRGGTDEQHNLQVTCRQCNQSKGNRQGPNQTQTNHAQPFLNPRW